MDIVQKYVTLVTRVVEAHQKGLITDYERDSELLILLAEANNGNLEKYSI